MTTDTMTFDTPGAVLVRISLDGGEVGLETWDERSVDVQLIALRDNDITRQVIEEARVEMSPRGGGHEIIVDLKRKTGLVARPRPEGRCPGALPRGQRSRASQQLGRPGDDGAARQRRGEVGLRRHPRRGGRAPGRRHRERRRPRARRRRHGRPPHGLRRHVARPLRRDALRESRLGRPATSRTPRRGSP